MHSFPTTDTTSTARPPLWRDLSPRFSNERDCLAAFLAVETAELLDGVKPGNLVNLVNRTQACGRNLYQLWRRFGLGLLACTGLDVIELCDRGDSLLLFIHNRAVLTPLLQEFPVKALLRRTGYPDEATPDQIIAELVKRFAQPQIPHEVGIFLGYPLKDVAAFMGIAPISFTCQGPWRIYGNPLPSLRVAQIHRACRSRMAWRVASCTDPYAILQQAI